MGGLGAESLDRNLIGDARIADWTRGMTMTRRFFLAATPFLTVMCATVSSAQQPSADEAGIRAIVQKYVDAREASDAKAIEPLFTPDADQLVSDGTWRRGRDQLVRGMLESSRKNPANRSIRVESVRLLSPDVALADGRYIQKGQTAGNDREMWTTITLKRGSDGWRIAAIRNMLPAKP
jgi:uncharacterized protein (TIGR02246 family)